MLRTGVILYGPPGAGKDTVSAALATLRPEYTLFQRLKAGPGRTVGYRLTTQAHIDELAATGELLYRNSRYGAEYAIDTGGLSETMRSGQIPVLHMGQVAGIRAVEAYSARWVRVLLWCPIEVTAERCKSRGDQDVNARLAAWRETRQDLLRNFHLPWSLIIETHKRAPHDAATAIDRVVRADDTEPSTPIEGLL